MRSPKKPELATSAWSPGSIRLAAAMSIASVPDPATMNGWPSGAQEDLTRAFQRLAERRR